MAHARCHLLVVLCLAAASCSCSEHTPAATAGGKHTASLDRQKSVAFNSLSGTNSFNPRRSRSRLAGAQSAHVPVLHRLSDPASAAALTQRPLVDNEAQKATFAAALRDPLAATASPNPSSTLPGSNLGSETGTQALGNAASSTSTIAQAPAANPTTVTGPTTLPTTTATTATSSAAAPTIAEFSTTSSAQAPAGTQDAHSAAFAQFLKAEGQMADGRCCNRPSTLSQHRCDFGTLPGWWNQSLHDVGEYKRVSFESPTSHSNESFPFGGRWKVFDPECQTTNHIWEILQLRWHQKHDHNISIVMLGDSVDAHVLAYFGEYLKYHYNGTEAWKKLDDRGEATWKGLYNQVNANYVRMHTGLHLYQIYIVSVDKTQPAPDLWTDRVNEISQVYYQHQADMFPNSPPKPPDLVVMASNFWPLQVAVTNATSHMWDDHMPLYHEEVLPLSFLEEWQANFTEVAMYVRHKFPQALMAFHTASHTMTNEDGTGGRPWSKRQWTRQMAAAGRHVSRKLHLPIIDWELLGSGYEPGQMLHDDIHPRDWFAFEALNLYINIAEQHREFMQSLHSQHGSSGSNARS